MMSWAVEKGPWYALDNAFTELVRQMATMSGRRF
mgnify:CR=1 FL=1